MTRRKSPKQGPAADRGLKPPARSARKGGVGSRKSEEALEQAVLFPSENPNPVLRVSREGTLLYGNPACRELLNDWRCKLGEKVPGSVQAQVNLALKSGKSVEWEMSREGKAISFCIAPIVDRGYANLYGRDITESKRLEAERDWIARQRQLALDAVHMGWWRHDPATGTLVWDERCRETFGVSRYQGSPRLILSRIHPDDRAKVWKAFLAAYDPADPKPYSAQYRVNRPDGSMRWVESHGLATFEGEAGARRATNLSGTILDVTEAKRAEAAIRESENRLLRAQEIAHLGSWELDVVNNRLLWSDEVYRIFGLEPQAFAATYEAFLESVHPDDRAAVDAAYTQSLSPPGAGYEIEHRIVRKGGEIRVVREKCEHTRDASGRVIRSLGMVHDITEQAQADQKLKAAEAQLREHAAELEETVARRTATLQETVAELEHFSYAITHDMRAPLRAMQGFATLVEEECSGCQRGSNQQYFQRIRKAANRMDQLIKDSLNYSRAVRQQLTLNAVHLRELVGGLVETYPNLQPDQADIEIEPSLPVVLGNEAALTQCFSNLLGNAVKFARPGVKPRVRVRCELLPPKARVWVEDNGIGIPAHALSRIFEMFQRASVEHEGTGIGLAIVRKVVRQMGGEVGVESLEGHGSWFWVELKLAPESQS